LLPKTAIEVSRLERLVEWVRMNDMKEWIVADPEHLGGSPRVRGTRISVALILESLAAGLSVAEIVDAYPSLTEKSVRGVLAELAHQQEPQHA
jgi:uncharacterized protein (DUF433 family)